MDEARPYTRMLTAQVRSIVQYRTSFALDVTSQTVFTVLDIVTVLVTFHVTPTLGGFSQRQVLLIGAFTAFAFALADLTVGNIERLSFYVRTGLLDAVLTRPLSAMGQLLVLDFAPRRIGRVLFATGLLTTMLTVNDIDWTAWRVLLAVITPVCATVFFSSVFVIGASVAFWWIDAGQFAHSFTYGGRDFTTYPSNIYQGAFRRIFAYALGFGFVSYYPVLGLLGVPDPLGLPPWFVWGGPVVATAAALIAAAIWRVGLRHYKGAGS
ncbi:transporter [Actinorhabdospora filicis]|uniref:Transporter n=1 Tax=Actinorhabdospora filicis TaxID=1785913 RepID=A0A9W6SQ91_9ACTN|nr:transporter [Actinorhabdospora filicis]